MDTAMQMKKRVNFCQFPHFFEVYKTRSSSERMKLPSGVSNRIPEGPIPTNLFLRNRCGKRFNVRLSSVGNDLFFEGDGWVQFLRDNNVVENHFLVFHFDGTDTFDFKIYELNGCEKIDEGEEDDDQKEVKVEVIEETNEPEGDEDKDDDVEDEDEDEELDEDDDAEDEDEELEDNNDEDAIDVEEDEEAEEEERFAKRNRGKGKAREARCDIYGTDIFKSGASIQPKNPYFVTRMKPNKKHMVHIPDDVVKDLQRMEYELPQELKVHDPRGRIFTLQLNAWGDGRIWYKDGWKRLCESNLVGVDDSIICEFIRRDGTEMVVTIVRTGT